MEDNVYIIVPSYNEGAVLAGTVRALLPLGYEIVVVDDGSDEDPGVLLAGLPVHLLRHAINLGQGAALQTGMDYAKLCGAAAVIHFDADGQHDPADIGRFLAALADGADVVLGSRFLPGAQRQRVPMAKRVLLQGARVINGLFTGMWLSDAHNGFRAMNRRALSAIELTENRMAHASEILSLIRKRRLHVQEIAVNIAYSDYSRQKGQKWYNSLNIIVELIMNKLF
ncbi:MAG: glycosyltransferase family 2 protein [Eubacteriales bacterium]|nr:glycosyltransferase family 2 protein [Eubacteriales bacterium]